MGVFRSYKNYILSASAEYTSETHCWNRQRLILCVSSFLISSGIEEHTTDLLQHTSNYKLMGGNVNTVILLSTSRVAFGRCDETVE